jgi:hypothetical protein
VYFKKYLNRAKIAFKMFKLILVHGYTLTEEGSLDPILTDRLDHALEVYGRETFYPFVVTAGKHGQRDRDFVLETGKSQARHMAEYLEEKGIPNSRLLLEEEGTTTWACTNRVYSEIVLPRRFDHVHIVSTEEHLPRIMYQDLQIFKSGLVSRTYSGPSINDTERREEFLRHELRSVRTTLDFFRTNLA